MRTIETTAKFARLKSISSIEGKYSFTLFIVICLFSSASLELQRKTLILYCEENVH